MYVFVDHVCGMFYVVGYLEERGGRSATDLTKISICFIRPTISFAEKSVGRGKNPKLRKCPETLFPREKKYPKKMEAFTAYI